MKTHPVFELELGKEGEERGKGACGVTGRTRHVHG